MLLLAFTILATSWFVPTANAGTVSDYIEPRMRVPTRCVDVIDPYGGYFESPPARVSLDRYWVCNPIRRKWRHGFPHTAYRQWRLAVAIFIVSHEEQHVEQWESGNPLNEQGADCGGAIEFRPWARRLRIFSRYNRRLLQRRITYPSITVGYPETNWEGCWR